MKIDNNNTEILSQITKELQNVYINNTGLESKIENICIINGDLDKSSINDRENDFINKIGLEMKYIVDTNHNDKEITKIDKVTKISNNCIENPKELNNSKYFIKNIQEKSFLNQKDNVIKLKTFKTKIDKVKNVNITKENKFNISNIDIENNIFAYNTYSEKYISEEEYASDTSYDDFSTSPFKYDSVIGISIPNNSDSCTLNKIASPQPESKFNIGSTIESFNKIADFIYENRRNNNFNESKLINSENNSLKKNDIFIKNYLDQTRYDDKKKVYYHKNNYHKKYITLKSLSNKKINSNDIIDRGCLCSIDSEDTMTDKRNEHTRNINKIPEINNKIDSNKDNISYYNFINNLELDSLNPYNNEPESRNTKEYILTEALDSTDNDEIEKICINNEKYYHNDSCDLNLNKQHIYDNCIFNLSS